MDKLALEQVGFIMGDWIPKEASIAIAVEGQYVYYKAGKRDLHIGLGDKVLPGSVAARTYMEGKRIEMLVEESILGAAYFGVGYPIEAAGKAGVLVIILPPDHMIQPTQPVHFLTGKVEETWHPVPINRISHIESSQKKTWFYAEEETYCSIHTLKYLKDRLPDLFLPIHRSYIVNISFIKEISRDFSSNYLMTMKDGSILPISQNYVSTVRERLGF